MEFLKALWNYLLVSGPYLLVGLTLAGFIHEYISVDKIKHWLGGKSYKSVLKAALVGVPLPLCSCSVIPTAVTLKKSGANNGATSAFLIATPESGIDSISLTYALMGLPMAIIRTLAAFVSAFLAGALQLIFNNAEEKKFAPVEAKSCCAKAPEQNHDHHSHPHVHANHEGKFKRAINFGFGSLVNDIAKWLTIGILVGALIDFLVPANFFMNFSPEVTRFLILLVGIPLYICATASTPIAVSLILKGLSPGSALILLLVGPATNIANVAVLQQYLGKKGVLINIFSIAFVAILFSYFADWLFTNKIPLDLSEQLSHHEHGGAWWQVASAIILSALLLKGIYIEEIKPRLKKKVVQKASCCN
jgi:uncharacterized protein